MPDEQPPVPPSEAQPSEVKHPDTGSAATTTNDLKRLCIAVENIAARLAAEDGQGIRDLQGLKKVVEEWRVQSKPPAPDPAKADEETTRQADAEATDFLWRTYGAIAEWIRFADVKAGAVLGANAALVLVAQSEHKKLFAPFSPYHLDFWFVVAILGTALGAFFLTASSVSSLSCISSKLVTSEDWVLRAIRWMQRKERRQGQDKARNDLDSLSLIFYEDIATRDELTKENSAVPTYLEAVQESVGGRADKLAPVVRQVAAQVVANAVVAAGKHRKIKWSVRLHAYALLCALLVGVVSGVTATVRPVKDAPPTPAPISGAAPRVSPAPTPTPSVVPTPPTTTPKPTPDNKNLIQQRQKPTP